MWLDWRKVDRQPSSFETPLQVEFEGPNTWKVIEEFDYFLVWGQPETIRVPAGFVTDFASIPRIFWNILPPTGKYGKAAVVHDYLYVMGGHLPDGREYTKREADRIFYDAMGVLGVNGFIRWTMWKAVSRFGKGNFLRT
jgi:hypothetical protein